MPEAHAEAPTIGSVILASLLLKLGGYGVIKFLLLGFTIITTQYFISFCLTLGLISSVYASFLAVRQIDLKKIVAYSSIAHMSFTLLGLFSQTLSGISGAVVLMIAHGFVSAALFFLVGMLYYRVHTRLIKYYSGLIILCPQLA